MAKVVHLDALEVLDLVTPQAGFIQVQQQSPVSLRINIDQSPLEQAAHLACFDGRYLDGCRHQQHIVNGQLMPFGKGFQAADDQPAAERVADQVDGPDLGVMAVQILLELVEQYHAHTLRSCAGLGEIAHPVLGERSHKA
ncbi:hypothetical protein D3C80_1806920 [compost metagenome]